MNTDMMFVFDVIVTVMLVAGGVYSLYSCIKLKKEQYLFENRILYPSNCQPDDCIDPEGFIQFIVPRMTFFGIMCIIFGLVTIGSSLLNLGDLATGIQMVAVVAVFAYIMVINNRSAKIFW